MEEPELEVAPPRPRRVVNRAKVNEETLVNREKGLNKLYNICSDFSFGDSAKSNLNNLIGLVQQWHYQAAPKFELNHFLHKCQTLANKPAVKVHLNRMRQVHKGEATWEEFDNEPEEQIHEVDDDQFEEEATFDDIVGESESMKRKKDDEDTNKRYLTLSP